jgi:hypothetical protein
MGKVSILCVILVFALLLEDGSSVRKKTEEEEREDREIAEKVNSTLAEEKEKEEEEKRRENEKEKKKLDQEENKKRGRDKKEVLEDKNEACLPTNTSCPIQKPCEDCPDCPSVRCDPCPKEKTCPPVLPCPTEVNSTVDQPPICRDPEIPVPAMTIPVAMAVGAVASLLVTGVAAAIGLLLRYVSPIVSGFLFLATIVILWYLCSQYPETARELGGRAAALVRDAAVTLSHRVMEAIQRQADQVGLS